MDEDKWELGDFVDSNCTLNQETSAAIELLKANWVEAHFSAPQTDFSIVCLAHTGEVSAAAIKGNDVENSSFVHKLFATNVALR